MIYLVKDKMENEQEVSLMKMQHWVCTYCGRRLTTSGRPLPGICVKKCKNRAGMPKPHSWVKG